MPRAIPAPHAKRQCDAGAGGEGDISDKSYFACRLEFSHSISDLTPQSDTNASQRTMKSSFPALRECCAANEGKSPSPLKGERIRRLASSLASRSWRGVLRPCTVAHPSPSCASPAARSKLRYPLPFQGRGQVVHGFGELHWAGRIRTRAGADRVWHRPHRCNFGRSRKMKTEPVRPDPQLYGWGIGNGYCDPGIEGFSHLSP